ncbi:MAG: aminotransferase class V-fold PLP-dependent enzyme [Sphaerochaetaceae bacterium]|nr:aminotransferase class V-fold PLP-dependent enzyme [Sphaerochaetaceae bacterium]
MNELFRPFLDKNTDKLDYIKNNTIGKHKSVYFDYTASGLGFRPIEDRIQDVLETYSNIHSAKDSDNSDLTSQHYYSAIASLKKSFELDEEFEILPGGCGSTASIKKLQELLGLYIPPATKKRYNISVNKENMPLVIVGPYEHHSNEVSYREAFCEIKRINLTKEGTIDLKQLANVLEENKHREIIGAFCIASNVTGIITCYKKVSKLLRKYDAIVCFDAAASSPYMNVECEYYDALFVSPHKLIGGPGSCGLLVIRKTLIDTTLPPTFAGGGTVTYVNKDSQDYDENILERESAGTPGILQLIRASLAYQLRNEIGFSFIQKRKQVLIKYFLDKLKDIKGIVIYGNLSSVNIGIVSFNILHINSYDVCGALSNNEGIQTRAGCSCAGPYGHDLLGIKSKESVKNQKPGWVRVSIHYSNTKKELDNLIDAIKEVAENI